jgi:hypothetical protein
MTARPGKHPDLIKVECPIVKRESV